MQISENVDEIKDKDFGWEVDPITMNTTLWPEYLCCVGSVLIL